MPETHGEVPGTFACQKHVNVDACTAQQDPELAEPQNGDGGFASVRSEELLKSVCSSGIVAAQAWIQELQYICQGYVISWVAYGVEMGTVEDHKLGRHSSLMVTF